MASTTFSGPVTSTNGFVGSVTGNVTGNLTGTTVALAAETLSSVSVSISSAEIKALFSTGKTLVAAPASGYSYLLDSIVLILGAGTAYTIGSATNLTVKCGSVTLSGTQSVTGFLDQAAGAVRVLFPANTSITPTTSALTLNLDGADVTTGTGTMVAKVNYTLIPIA